MRTIKALLSVLVLALTLSGCKTQQQEPQAEMTDGDTEVISLDSIKQLYLRAYDHIQKIIDFVDDVIGNVGVILVTAWTRCPQVEHIIHRYPQPVFLSKCFGNTLLDFKGAYMWLAISTLRFI